MLTDCTEEFVINMEDSFSTERSKIQKFALWPTHTLRFWRLQIPVTDTVATPIYLTARRQLRKN